MNFLDQTVNMISLFAFIMTLGILVDDAIIVGENIFTHYSRGKKPSAAVIDGLKELDQIAYIRYAIVYLGLDDLQSIRKEIDKLLEN